MPRQQYSTYTASAVTGATSYTWTLSSGWTGSSTTNTITINLNSMPGTLAVASNNSCGTGNTRSLTIFFSSIPSALLSVTGDSVFCQGDSVLLQAPNQPGVNYRWLRNDTAILGATFINHTAKTQGSYHFIATTTAGCADTSRRVSVFVTPLPMPVITVNGVAGLSTGAFSAYQWYKDGAPISGANIQNHTATENGSYQVMVTNNSGCSNMSPAVNINKVSINNIADASSRPALYPNPNSGGFTLSWPVAKGEISIELLNTLGQVLYRQSGISSGKSIALPTEVPGGSYLLRCTSGNERVIVPFTIR